MKKILATLIALNIFIQANSQVGIGTTTPNQSSALDITDSTKGLLIPRMTITKRNAIINPAVGLMVYQTDSTKGFWYFDGTSWKNINASSNYGGKHTIILSDTITNAQAITKLAVEYGPNTQELRIEGCLYLTAIDLSIFTSLANITITDNPLLQSINFQNLKICEGYFSINNCPALNNLNVGSLEKIIYAADISVNALYVNNVGLTSINFPKLKRVLGIIGINKNTVLSSVTFPLLTGEVSLIFRINNALQTISFPLLQSIGIMQTSTNHALTTLSFPNVTKFTTSDLYVDTWIDDSPNLTSIVLGNLTQFANYGFRTDNTKLPSNVINDLLHKFVSIIPHVSGKEFLLMQTPAAPPTGQGLLDKAELVALGNTVQTN